MTNNEFQIKLQEMYKKYPMIAKRESKIINELFYVLRMDEENDYNINVIDNGFVSCIPSVKKCFVPVKLLSKRVKYVECDEEDYGCEEVCLTVTTERE